MKQQILTVVHQQHSTPGKIGEFLVARGFALDRRCPMLGDTLPRDLSAYAAAIVFGGPQSAMDDQFPGIRAELDWLERHAIGSGTPLLGICLGAQQIARVLGAKVGPRGDGSLEIGYARVSPTDAGRAFLARPTMFYQWHSETFEIPACAVHLAHNGAFPGQAFRSGTQVHAIEYHPEMTREMIDTWCTSERGSKKLTLPGAQAHAEQLADYDRYAAENDRWLGEFLDGTLLAEFDID